MDLFILKYVHKDNVGAESTALDNSQFLTYVIIWPNLDCSNYNIGEKLTIIKYRWLCPAILSSIYTLINDIEYYLFINISNYIIKCYIYIYIYIYVFIYNRKDVKTPNNNAYMFSFVKMKKDDFVETLFRRFFSYHTNSRYARDIHFSLIEALISEWTDISTYYYYYYYLFIRIFHICVNRWSLTGFWVTASLLKSPGLFSVFWRFSIVL